MLDPNNNNENNKDVNNNNNDKMNDDHKVQSSFKEEEEDMKNNNCTSLVLPRGYGWNVILNELQGHFNDNNENKHVIELKLRNELLEESLMSIGVLMQQEWLETCPMTNFQFLYSNSADDSKNVYWHLDEYETLSTTIQSHLHEQQEGQLHVVPLPYTLGSIDEHMKRMQVICHQLTTLTTTTTTSATTTDKNNVKACVIASSPILHSSLRHLKDNDDNNSAESVTLVNNNKSNGDNDNKNETKQKTTTSNKENDVMLNQLQEFAAMDGNSKDSMTNSNNNKKKKKKQIDDSLEEKKMMQSLSQFHLYALGQTKTKTTLSKEQDEEKLMIRVEYSLFHPPSRRAQLRGDLAYLQVILLDASTQNQVLEVYYITAIAQGFYVNQTDNPHSWNSSPRFVTPQTTTSTATANTTTLETKISCHYTLMDCLCHISSRIANLWVRASLGLHQHYLLQQQPQQQQYNTVGDVLDVDLKSPLLKSLASSWFSTWLEAPSQDTEKKKNDGTVSTTMPPPSTNRLVQHLQQGYGFHIESGLPRDWNEEYQSAKEMPTTTFMERLERARVLNKTMTDYSQASIQAVKAVVNGAVKPMNPHEVWPYHVYWYNSIFISRAVDGMAIMSGQNNIGNNNNAYDNIVIRSQPNETLKFHNGNRAAAKSVLRDLAAHSLFHRIDVHPVQREEEAVVEKDEAASTTTADEKKSDEDSASAVGLYTLGMCLVDYGGCRFVCQTIVPGILQGEKSHEVVYGAIEYDVPLANNPNVHESVENILGQHFMCATRTVSALPYVEEKYHAKEKEENAGEDEKYDEDDEKKKKKDETKVEKNDENETKEEDKGKKEKKDKEDDNDDDDDATKKVISMCGPVELKGIRGSDERHYILDLARVSPRDANWIPKNRGGTGVWQDLQQQPDDDDEDNLIPSSLEDDEWTTAVLRHELVTQMTHYKMALYFQEKEQQKQQKKEAKEEANNEKEDPSRSKEDQEPKEESQQTEDKNNNNVEETKPQQNLSEEDREYLKSLRFNVNCFLPHLRNLNDIVEPNVLNQLVQDEEAVREASLHLWEKILPRLTLDIRRGGAAMNGAFAMSTAGQANLQQLQHPVDGKGLTEMLHQRGINCRYLGRLAMLAQEEEVKDTQQQQQTTQGNNNDDDVAAMGGRLLMDRKRMPLSWLELLEVEMVARAAKHVLDSYLWTATCTCGGAMVSQPCQVIASFLSALVSEAEESAADTEERINRQQQDIVVVVDEDDLNAMTMGDPSVVIKTRKEIWHDIESEVGRRFRYKLTLYNRNYNGRAMHLTLLRRVCQRTGIRLEAKDYNLGGKCLTSSSSFANGSLMASYPISPLDIVDIVPLVKHAGALHGQGFCNNNNNMMMNASVVPPPSSMHLLMTDAKVALESAHYALKARSFQQALDFANEACVMYQRITEGAPHVTVARCMDLIAVILFQAGQTEAAIDNAEKSLETVLSSGDGIDSPKVLTCHLTLSHMFLTAAANNNNLEEEMKQSYIISGIQHLRCAIYLCQMMGGRHYCEIPSMLQKLAATHYEMQDVESALFYFYKASSMSCSDRILECIMAKSTAVLFGTLGRFREAIDMERRASRSYELLLGEDHDLTRRSKVALARFTTLAVQQQQAAVLLEEKEKVNNNKEGTKEEGGQEEEEEEEEEAATTQSKKKKKKKSKKKR